MTDNKKEQERAELQSRIWSITGSLRGSADGWDFTSYVPGTMLMRPGGTL